MNNIEDCALLSYRMYGEPMQRVVPCIYDARCRIKASQSCCIELASNLSDDKDALRGVAAILGEVEDMLYEVSEVVKSR
ncbi:MULTISPECIES: hypothetical protein [Gordonibacter]|uniref:Uncharacterized protein n=1 Tax=Gordonibacter faecis TaxID=3047475 RepID=A0ABT7DPY5_9ACTN|nr:MULTISPECIES: hypothetical protein [unclassified Gordonibacter]MDJ1651614.1 hypothetical protein [Gordonibacter sp. KGMB12511]HIW77036.1 hypothetical protein [Candidatus Gordonibacter avicola]